MKRAPMYLDELSAGSRLHGLKVTIKKKQRVQHRPGKTSYQNLSVEDDKGHSMSAIIFGDDIEYFKTRLEPDKEYELGNASINRTPEQFRERWGDLQMVITNRCLVRPLDSGASSSQTTRCHSLIASIPRVVYTDKQYDLMVAVLYVGPVKMVGHGNSRAVSELVVMNDSIADTRVVSIWNDLATPTYDKIATLMAEGNTPVVELTYVTLTSYKGFAFSTSSCTLISYDPEGERAVAVRNWLVINSESVKSWKLRVEEARNPSFARKITKLGDVLSKTREEIIQEDIFRIKVHVTNFSEKDINLYIGCKNCGKKCGHVKDSAFL